MAPLGYALVALAVVWPLPLHIATHLTGTLGGDTSAYVWNLWIFRHELVDHHHWPFYTRDLMVCAGGIDLGLHNYTVFSDLLALPLLPALGVVATFNVIYLLQLILSGQALFLLARRLTGRTLEAWLAGAVFLASPVLTARGTAHFSLVAAAPLPLFLLATLRYGDTARLRHAAGAGVALAWSAYCDAYYPVYCALLATFTFAPRLFVLSRAHAAAPPGLGRRVLIRLLDAVLIALSALVSVVATCGVHELHVLGQKASLRTFYTPMLAVTLLALARLGLATRPRLGLGPSSEWRRLAVFAVVGGVVATLLLAPLVFALAQQVSQGNFVSPRILWRSSPRGVDVLGFLLPNPNHPLFGGPSRAWLTRQRADDLQELTASLSLVALGVILVAARLKAAVLPRLWIGLSCAFGLLALGPFVHVAGINTCIPGPWALLRFAPLIGLARTPARFSVVVTLTVAVLFAFALAGLRDRYRGCRRALTVGVALLLAFELLPVPRTLHAASISPVFERIRTDPNANACVLELPWGVSDGTFSVGSFSSAVLFRQTYHQKAVLGGYVSRVPEQRVRAYRELPVLAVLMSLSEGGTPPPSDAPQLSASQDACLRQGRLAYVVMEEARTSSALKAFAIRALGLKLVSVAEGYALYVPSGTAEAPSVE